MKFAPGIVLATQYVLNIVYVPVFEIVLRLSQLTVDIVDNILRRADYKLFRRISENVILLSIICNNMLKRASLSNNMATLLSRVSLDKFNIYMFTFFC